MIHSSTKTLTEHESKNLLRKYGIPVVAEILASTEQDAVAAAGRIGFPVVVKGMGINLAHKTERGAVKLNLRSQEEVQQACRSIRQSAGSDLENYLVQPLVEGRREFTAGMIRDDQFGPVVMFGLGGILTEVFHDVVFRIAPVSRSQALAMMEETLSRKLLGDFRGESAADIEKLVEVITALSRLGLERPDVREVDINPLLISPDGCVTAVDALVVMASNVNEGPKDRTPEEVGAINAALHTMMHPRNIAVIGATRALPDGYPGMFAAIKRFGFPGRLYPINPNSEEIEGVKTYPNLASLPEPVDLVIISLAAPLVADALRECIASKNKNIHIFSAGFKETGEANGIAMQAEIEKIALDGGLHVVGPNCMGFYVPSSKLLTWVDGSDTAGPISLVSQSGGNAENFTSYCSSHFGIGFNKVISYGNALTLDCTDFLEYLADDDGTRILTMYLEGVKNGRKLFCQVSEINRGKPVIILKGGLTDSGARAVASHTGSMAGVEKIWDAFFKQTGSVRVDSLEEMADAAAAFLHFENSPGRRVAVIGIGGGVGVAAADSCARAGLELPLLPPEVFSRLCEFIPLAGNMIRNPIDALIAFLNVDFLGKTLESLPPELIDMFIISLHVDWLYKHRKGFHIKTIARYIATEGRKHTSGRPLAVVWRQSRTRQNYSKARIGVEKILQKGGIPLYQDVPRAAAALSKLAGHSEFKRTLLEAMESPATKKPGPDRTVKNVPEKTPLPGTRKRR